MTRLSLIFNNRTIHRNFGYNLVGFGLPLLVAVAAIPPLVSGLGVERFGILALVWMVIGYFSLFDLGVARALTKTVAEETALGHEDNLGVVVWTALGVMAFVGILGAIAMASLSPWFIFRILKIPSTLLSESLRASYVLSLSIPVVIWTAGLRGVLEGRQEFATVNALRVVLGTFSFVGPLAVLPFSNNLVPIVAVLLVGRLLACLAHFILCLRLVPSLRRSVRLSSTIARTVLRTGGWMTVSNITEPLLVNLDKLLLGALISVGSVAYYATPYEIVTKLWLVPSAITAVLFPAFAADFARDRSRVLPLFSKGVGYIILILLPLTVLVMLFAYSGLNLWLGSEFAGASTRVLQLLAVGVLFSSLSSVPFALVQGAGRADLTAKLRLAEFPFYVVGAWYLIGLYAIDGAAIAWTARMAADAIALFAMAYGLLHPRVLAVILPDRQVGPGGT